MTDLLDVVLPEPCERCGGSGWITHYIGQRGRDWHGQIACGCNRVLREQETP